MGSAFLVEVSQIVRSFHIDRSESRRYGVSRIRLLVELALNNRAGYDPNFEGLCAESRRGYLWLTL
jgi:hypothetical protein